jgi:hypothetical protein
MNALRTYGFRGLGCVLAVALLSTTVLADMCETAPGVGKQVALPAAPAAHAGKTARDIFYAAGDAAVAIGAPAIPRQIALAYRIEVASVYGGLSAVTEDHMFQSWDRARLVFESNINGFLYIFARGSSSTGKLLFPDPRINAGRNDITAFTPYTVPARGWFQFDNQPGTEKLYIFLSPTRLANLDGAIQTASGATLTPDGFAVVTAAMDRGLKSRAAGYHKKKDIFYVDQGQPVSDATAFTTATTYVAGPVVQAQGSMLLHDIALQHTASLSQVPLRSSRDIFYNAGPGVELPTHIGLAYKILLATPSGFFTEVTENNVFRTGDKFRLLFRSNLDGSLYIFHRAASGRCYRLFPHAAINEGKNLVTLGSDYIVPASGWFEFDNQPGKEKLYIFLSPTPLVELDQIQAQPNMLMNDQGWGIVTAAFERAMRSMPAVDRKSRDIVFVQPGQGVPAGGTQTMTTYVTLPIVSPQSMLIHDITLEHQ